MLPLPLLLAAQRFIRYAVAHIKCEKEIDRERDGAQTVMYVAVRVRANKKNATAICATC